MKNTERAFVWITDILEKNRIIYKISGGFAARVYGVSRELADIDIEIKDENITKIETEVKPYIIFGPAHYKDENWDLQLMTLLYEGQEIDIAGTKAKIFNKQTKKWENCSGDLHNVEIHDVYGKKVPIEQIGTLVAYKKKLSRDVDLEDVKQLEMIYHNGK